MRRTPSADDAPSVIAAELSGAARPDRRWGVFETLLVRDGRVQALELHLERLASAVADLYGYRLPGDLPRDIRATARQLGGTQRLRVDAEPGRGDLALGIEAEPLAGDLHRVTKLRAVVLPGGLGAYKFRDRRLVDGLSSAPLVPLIVDADGRVLEAAWGNVWVVEGNDIVTPPAHGALLPGVTRSLLLQIAGSLGLSASTEAVSLDRARQADAIFVTSSLRHAVGAELDGTSPRGRDHPAVERIRTALGATAWDGGRLDDD